MPVVDALLKAADPRSPSRGPRRDPRLEPVAEKVRCGARLTIDEGELLYTTPDIWGVCELADSVRRRLHSEVAYYNVNRHINYSNVCALSCKFCAFYRKRGDEGAYEMDVGAVVAEARKAADAGATELHIVGGLHPYLPFSYYTGMLSAIRGAVPELHLKAFTAVEIVHLAKLARQYRQEGDERRESIRWVLSELKKAGLGSLPGGGAEVFDDRVHDEAYRGKIRSDVWLDVHRVAHELGLNTNATILYGHIEQRRERLVHMDMLRRVQDESLARLGYEAQGAEAPGRARACGHSEDMPASGLTELAAPVVTLTRPGVRLPAAPPRSGSGAGRDPARPGASTPPCPSHGCFQTIIPLPFFPDASELEQLPGPSGIENLRTVAVSRLMLDNFPHVKAFWIMQTIGMAQLMLQSGADDIDGTVVWYDITKVGGSDTHQEQGVWELCKAIREAGFEPVERDTLYRRVLRGPGGPRAWRIE